VTRSREVRFALLVLNYGKEIACHWHRTSIEPGVDAAAMLAGVDVHLREWGRAPIGDADKVALIVRLAELTLRRPVEHVQVLTYMVLIGMRCPGRSESSLALSIRISALDRSVCSINSHFCSDNFR
jgi:hypothetical protein